MYAGRQTTLSADTCTLILLCFEGPDEYSMAGGLGVRVTELAHSLAEKGYHTHLVFMGDPHKPPQETLYGGQLELHRWAQWVSRYYPHGVYDGEEAKLAEFSSSVPGHVVHLCRQAVENGRIPVVLAEDWHTAAPLCTISDLLHGEGLRQRSLLLWNANNTAGFHRVDFPRLNFCATLLTVSRFMKHEMWKRGVNPIVVPNGIPSRLVHAEPPLKQAGQLRTVFGDGMTLFKIGRFSPDKRWMMAVEALAQLVHRGISARLIARGGIEPHGGEVLARAAHMGLTVTDVFLDKGKRTFDHLIQALKARPGAHIYNLKYFVPEEATRALYCGADAVLANSGFEPFGLVGLEVMAAGGVAVTGATGEDYARNGWNALVAETDDPWELAVLLQQLAGDHAWSGRIKEEGRRTAATYTWPQVIDDLLHRLNYVAQKQGVISQAAPAAQRPPVLDQTPVRKKEGVRIPAIPRPAPV